MYIIKETEIFSKWLLKLKDIKGKVSILRRIKRVSQGNFGDCKFVGDSVSELIKPIKRYRKSQKIGKGVPK